MTSLRLPILVPPLPPLTFPVLPNLNPPPVRPIPEPTEPRRAVDPLAQAIRERRGELPPLKGPPPTLDMAQKRWVGPKGEPLKVVVLSAPGPWVRDGVTSIALVDERAGRFYVMAQGGFGGGVRYFGPGALPKVAKAADRG